MGKREKVRRNGVGEGTNGRERRRRTGEGRKPMGKRVRERGRGPARSPPALLPSLRRGCSRLPGLPGDEGRGGAELRAGLRGAGGRRRERERERERDAEVKFGREGEESRQREGTRVAAITEPGAAAGAGDGGRVGAAAGGRGWRAGRLPGRGCRRASGFGACEPGEGGGEVEGGSRRPVSAPGTRGEPRVEEEEAAAARALPRNVAAAASAAAAAAAAEEETAETDVVRKMILLILKTFLRK
ncbi:uncharacterized protein RHO17_016880 [Thomomys bottae]